MIFTIPGLRTSSPDHWQSHLERQYPEKFTRIHQDNWAQPDCETWIKRIDRVLADYQTQQTVLIGHSVGCAAIVKWFEKYKKPLKGALLVAPSDVENPHYPTYITGFSPLYLQALPFPSIVVASTNDHVVQPDRARFFAQCWGSDFVILPQAGHIEDKSGFGEWPQGLQLAEKLLK